MLHAIATLIGLGTALWVGFDFIKEYRASTLTGWPRVWGAAKGSATIAWQQFGIVISGLTAASTGLAEFAANMAGDPSAGDTIKGYIQSALKPEYVGLAMIAFMGVTIWARMRSLGKPPSA